MSPSPLCSVEKVPSLSYPMDPVQFLLWPEEQVSVSSQLIELLKHVNYTLPQEPGVTQPYSYYKACLPWSLIIHYVLRSNSHVALCGK